MKDHSSPLERVRRSLPARILRRLTLNARDARGEAGETLIEVLLALIILSLASVALITAFETSINASAEHRSLASFNTVLASSISTTTSAVQQQNPSVFNSCLPLSGYPSSAQITAEMGVSGYTAAIDTTGSQPAVEYSDNGSYSTNCTPGDVGNPQLINVVVTDTATGISQSNTVVVDDPVAVQLTGVTGSTANELVFITQPEGATVGNDFATQPQLEVEDNGVIVTSDLSPITLTIGTGPAGASLSNTCSGQETAGIVSYTGCSLNVIGTGFELFASEPDPSHPGLSLTSSSAPFSVYPSQLSTPAITSVVPSTVSTGAINVSFTGAANAPNGQTYSVKVCQDGAMSVNCVIQNNFVSGNDVTGLNAGTMYYAQITATASTNFLGSTSPPSGPALATVQLRAPGVPTLAYGPSSGSITIVSFTGSGNGPPSETYSALVCSTPSMNGPSCVTNSNIVTGNSITGLTPGLTYYVELSGNASTGYLASARGPQSVGQPATTALTTPTGFSTSPSATQAAAIEVTFTASTGTPPSSYLATVCTNAAMSLGCLYPPINPGTSQISLGLTSGTNYYVTITAVSTTNGVASATTAVSGPTLATVPLTAPSNVVVGYGATAGSVSVSAGPSNGPAGQIYTAKACTNTAMTAGCVPVAPYTLGADITGLVANAGAAGTTYFVQITANASSGYLASPASTQASHADTGLIGAPVILTVTTPAMGDIMVTFNAPTGTAPAPLSYTAVLCSQPNGGGTCLPDYTNFTSGHELTGLTPGQRYYVELIAVAPAGYANDTAYWATRITVT